MSNLNPINNGNGGTAGTFENIMLSYPIENNEKSESIVLETLQRSVKFSILCAFHPDRNVKENAQAHEKLRSEIRALSGNCAEIEVGYKFLYKGIEEFYEERYLFASQLTFYSLIKLGRRYQQDTAVFNDIDGFNLISTAKGHVLKAFGVNRMRPKFVWQDIPLMFKWLFKSRTSEAINPEVVFIRERRLLGGDIK